MYLRILRVIVAIAAILAIGYFAGVYSERSRTGSGIGVGGAGQSGPVVRSTGEAAIGGPFTLVDTRGGMVTEQDLKGRFALVFFGFTNCPDVCPLAMNRISMALETLSEETEWRDELQPVFVSVDAARDTPPEVKAFLANYHPAFIGLTGSAEQVARAAAAYKVAYEEMLDGEHDHTGPITHSSHIYLMSPEGEYLTHFDSAVTAPELARAIQNYLG